MKPLYLNILIIFSLYGIATSQKSYEDVSKDFRLIKELNAQVYEFLDATLSGDDLKTVEYTAEALISQMGGKEKYLEYTKNTRLKLEENQMSLEYNSLDPNGTIAKDSTGYYSIVSYTSFLKMPQERYMILVNLLLGYLKPGTDKWKFVSSNNNDSILYSIFPSWSKDFVVPFQRKKPIFEPAVVTMRKLRNLKCMDLATRGQYEKAIAEASFILDTDSTNFNMYFCRSSWYNEMKQYEKAIPDVEYVLSMFPKSIKALHLRATLYTKMGDYDKSIQDYKSILDQENDDATSLNNFAWNIYLSKDKEQYSEALTLVNKAMSIEKRNSYYSTRGRILFELGKYIQAKDDLNRYISHSNYPDPDGEKEKVIQLLSIINEKLNAN